jgi:hypothetical protein
MLKLGWIWLSWIGCILAGSRFRSRKFHRLKDEEPASMVIQMQAMDEDKYSPTDFIFDVPLTRLDLSDPMIAHSIKQLKSKKYTIPYVHFPDLSLSCYAVVSNVFIFSQDQQQALSLDFKVICPLSDSIYPCLTSSLYHQPGLHSRDSYLYVDLLFGQTPFNCPPGHEMLRFHEWAARYVFGVRYSKLMDASKFHLFRQNFTITDKDLATVHGFKSSHSLNKWIIKHRIETDNSRHFIEDDNSSDSDVSTVEDNRDTGKLFSKQQYVSPVVRSTVFQAMISEHTLTEYSSYYSKYGQVCAKMPNH